MGFKTMSKKIDTKNKEEEFLNSARGDDLEETKSNAKRKQVALYLNDKEYAIVKELSQKLGMNISQYVRFKILNDNLHT